MHVLKREYDLLKPIHKELKQIYWIKVNKELENNFDKLIKNSKNNIENLRIIKEILKLLYFNYDICPHELRVTSIERCKHLAFEAKSNINKNKKNKYPWYKEKNKCLKKIIYFCDKITK